MDINCAELLAIEMALRFLLASGANYFKPCSPDHPTPSITIHSDSHAAVVVFNGGKTNVKEMQETHARIEVLVEHLRCMISKLCASKERKAEVRIEVKEIRSGENVADPASKGKFCSQRLQGKQLIKAAEVPLRLVDTLQVAPSASS